METYSYYFLIQRPATLQLDGTSGPNVSTTSEEHFYSQPGTSQSVDPPMASTSNHTDDNISLSSLSQVKAPIVGYEIIEERERFTVSRQLQCYLEMWF